MAPLFQYPNKNKVALGATEVLMKLKRDKTRFQGFISHCDRSVLIIDFFD